ncbi:nucleoside monophosphate kinase [Microscilla marina]|uniref:Adenylate kinase n=1 Tax=Microscilla marina ATCC 23134 TaxID=313606 RepID=A1ZQW0_MICM2|nr:nucleoside monophosphate kinase [Microscilla marina]EAY27265.1 hypothetical protein M23134_06575 [Microscilla marina ATCC 23134]
MKQILIIYGPPYSGSSHTGLQIADYYKGVSLSVSDLMRKEVREKSKLGSLLSSYIQKGQVIPLSVTEQLLYESFKQHQNEELLVFINFPKNTSEAESIAEIAPLFGYQNINTVSLVINEQMIIERMQQANTHDVEAIWEKLESYYTNISFVINHYEETGILQVIDFSENVNFLVEEISKSTGLKVTP